MASKDFYAKPQAPAPVKVDYSKPHAAVTKVNYVKLDEAPPTGLTVTTIDNANE